MSSDSIAVGVVGERVGEKTFMAVTWAATSVSLLFLLFRLAIRVGTFRKLFSDDYLAVAAWLMLLTSCIVWQIKVHILYWMYDITFGRVPFTPDFPVAYATFIDQVVTWNILFYTGLWTIKYSFLMFFRRLASQVPGHRLWWWIVFCILPAGWIASIADIDWKCSLSSVEYIETQCSLPERIAFDNRTFYGNMAGDIITDLLILSIPIAILWNVRISLQKKILLVGLFSATVLIMVISIIRVVLVKGTRSQQLQDASIEWLYLWSNVEMGIAIIVSCLASFRQLFTASRKAQAGPGDGQTQTAPHIGRYWRSYFPFKKLRSTGNLRQSQQGDGWSYTPQPPRVAASLDSADSQTYIVPLDTVHVRNTINFANASPMV